jgi:hypothetical protein
LPLSVASRVGMTRARHRRRRRGRKPLARTPDPRRPASGPARSLSKAGQAPDRALQSHSPDGRDPAVSTPLRSATSAGDSGSPTRPWGAIARERTQPSRGPTWPLPSPRAKPSRSRRGPSRRGEPAGAVDTAAGRALLLVFHEHLVAGGERRARRGRHVFEDGPPGLRPVEAPTCSRSALSASAHDGAEIPVREEEQVCASHFHRTPV